MVKVVYSSNNSGGDWWLTDEDWKTLEVAGWKVEWFKDSPNHLMVDAGGRFLGALADRASKEFKTLEDGIDEWEVLTGQNHLAHGCDCCGQPHYFYEEKECNDYH